MTSLLEIRNRIQSVQSVRQITKAMEMVAASEMKKAKTAANYAKTYYIQMKKIVYSMQEASIENPAYFKKNNSKKTLLLIAGSDRGLCGSYNSALFSRAEKFLKGYLKEDIELILIGKKTISHFSHQRFFVLDKIFPMGSKINKERISQLTKTLIDGYLSGIYCEVIILSTHATNALSSEPIIETLLPFEEANKEDICSNSIYEPSQEDLFPKLVPIYLESKLTYLLKEAFATELFARTFAMKKATNNASEMLEDLIITRNKIRQASITREMIEITSGGVLS